MTAVPRIHAAALAACAAFLALGALLLPFPGFQADEVLFASPLFAPVAWHARIRMFHTDIPTMLMSYLGALKTWLFAAILPFTHPTSWTVRLPMLLVSVAGIWLVYRLLTATAGPRPALFACILLSTDPLCLMTGVFDWGPVALQHFFFAAGLLGLTLFHQRRHYLALAAGCAALGLGLWEKASFAWLLAALAVAGLAAFPREIRRHLRWKPLIVAALNFTLGALPLLIYNAQHRAATLNIGIGINGAEFDNKFASLVEALQGSGLYGHLAAEDPSQPTRAPSTTLQRASLALHDTLGHRAGSLGALAFSLSTLVALALWRRSRGLRFLLVFLATAWLAMLLTRGAGAAVHHTLLLWPAVPMFLALALHRALPRTPAAAVILAVLTLSNLVIYNEYLSTFIRYGSRAAFTTAIAPLANRLLAQHPRGVCIADWGLVNQLRLLGRGTLPISDISFTLLGDSWSDADRQSLRRCIADPSQLIVTHSPALEEFHGARARLEAWAAGQGFAPVPDAVIADELGRPVFETFRFAAKIQ